MIELNELWLSTKISEAIKSENNAVSLRQEKDSLPNYDELNQVCEEVGLSLGLHINWEDYEVDNSEYRDLLFYWE